MEQYTKECIPEVLPGAEMMAAQLKLHLDPNGQKYNVDDLVAWVQTFRVKTGIKKDAIQRMIDHDIYDVYVEIARGKSHVKGKDGYYIYHVRNAENTRGPKILDHGEVEYVHTNVYTIVEKDQLLAEYIPATNGEYGYTVDNKMLTPKKGSDLPPLRGKGFRLIDGKYYSNLHGKVEINEVGIHVTNLLEVKEDLDIEHGHIDFDGDVSVRGDVHSGMIVKAKGNVEIGGHVGNCYIDAGGNISIRQGMQGKFSGRLRAGGDIICKFFENANASAGGDIIVRSAMNSKLEAGGLVKMEGKDAVVLGGSIYAVQGMELTDVGNESEIPTQLVAGVLPDTFKRYAELTKLEKKVEEEVALLDKASGVMQRMMGAKVTEEITERRMKILQAKVIKSTELKRYKNERIRLEALIASGQDAMITVQNTIYPGCSVEITGVSVRVKDKVRHVKFVLNGADIDMRLLF